MASSKRKKVLGGLLFLLLSLNLALAFPLTLTDARGKSIRLKKSPQRIVSLVPSVTEVLCSLGLYNQLVGVTSWCNFPPKVKEKAVVGSLYLDYEKIIALNPDLIVADASVRHSEIDRLESLDFPVLAVNSRNLEGLKESLCLLGRATGKEKKAKQLLEDFEKTLNQLKAQKQKQGKAPRVFVEIWFYPLMSTGKGTFMDEMISLAGGANIFGKLKADCAEVSLEEVVSKDPQVIILTSAKPKDLDASPVWRSTTAVKEKRVYELDPDTFVRPTLRLPQTLKNLNQLFYPPRGKQDGSG